MSNPLPLAECEKEIWKDIPGYEGFYRASTLGRIMRFRPWKKIGAEKILKPISTSQVYKVVKLSKDGKGTTYKIHRIIAQTFLGERSAGKTINHKDCNKANNAISNLEYVTQSENIRHAIKMGLFKVPPKGEDHQNAKIKNADVLKIRSLYKNGTRMADIARLFRILPSNVWYICHVGWKNVGGL